MKFLTILTVIMCVNFSLFFGGYVGLPDFSSSFGMDYNTTSGVISTNNTTAFSGVVGADVGSFDAGTGLTIFSTLFLVWDVVILVFSFAYALPLTLIAVGAPTPAVLMGGVVITAIYLLSVVSFIAGRTD